MRDGPRADDDERPRLPGLALRPANLFVWRPARALVVATLFLAAFLAVRVLGGGRRRSWPLLVPAPAWAPFGYNEYLAHRYGWNIRIDLLVTWPALLGLSITCIGLALHLTTRARGPHR